MKKFSVALKKFANSTSERALPPPQAPAVGRGDAGKGGRGRGGRAGGRMGGTMVRFKSIQDDGICSVGERLQNGDMLVRTSSHLIASATTAPTWLYANNLLGYHM